MSARIAHRPHYRHLRQSVPSYRSTRQPFFRTRWSYRRQSLTYEKHPLGYRLSLISPRYFAPRNIILPQL
jgi:hypothetical protein